MASNEMEVLESVRATENVESSESGFALTRRQLMSALTVAGAAAGISLVSGRSAAAQQPVPKGYSEIDVMNLLLNVKYLIATLYSYVTQGTDLPGTATTGTLVGSGTTGTIAGGGGIYNAPSAKIAFTGTNAAQITDLFLELYYDELNHVIDLRNLLGNAVVGRQTINLLGNGATSTTKTSYTPSEVIALARMLEDVSVTAFAGATIYLSGSNLDYASRVLAADGFHAGALRLVSIQTGAQYQSPAYAFGSVTTGGETAVSFTGATFTGTNQIYSTLGTVIPTVGSVLTGVGIPQGSGAVITGVTSKASIAPTAIVTKGVATIANVSSLTGVANNQPVTGTNIAAGTYVQSFDPTAKTITLSVAPTGSSTVAPTGYVTSGSTVVTRVSSVSGIAVGQPITGSNIPAGTTVAAVSSSAATITMSAAATATNTTKVTGVLTAGSPQITSLSSTTGLAAGQAISGTGIPSNAFIGSITGSTLTLADSSGQPNVTASVSSAVTATYTFTGIVTAGSNVITPSGTFSGVVAGQAITGAGIPAGTTIASFNSTSVTLSNNATTSSTASFKGVTYIGSAVISSVSSVSGLVAGQAISGPGIPANATIASVSSSAGTVTMSAAATQINTTPVTFTSPSAVTLTTTTSATSLTVVTPETVTVPTTQAITIGQSLVTIAGNATATGVQTITVLMPDAMDVEPADPGDPATAAKGPQLVAGTSSSPIYQGFFNTAGSANASANTPAGLAFTRTFSQVLDVLLNTNPSNAIVTTQNYQGGFYPVGVSGTITSVA